MTDLACAEVDFSPPGRFVASTSSLHHVSHDLPVGTAHGNVDIRIKTAQEFVGSAKACLESPVYLKSTFLA